MSKTNSIVTYGVFMALTVVMTMIIQIPAPASVGYLNLGDMVIFMAAFMFGKKGGFLVGGLGSALADILLGWGVYAPITFVAKGLEGFVAGMLFDTAWGRKMPLLAAGIGGVVMATGYYAAEIFMYGAKAALVNYPANIMQGLFGAVAASILYALLKNKIKVKREHAK
ncbi:MAG: ECF transporter S component [Gudongella sp.]|nr:ECF transporter S component [Gudongella sp.]